MSYDYNTYRFTNTSPVVPCVNPFTYVCVCGWSWCIEWGWGWGIVWGWGIRNHVY